MKLYIYINRQTQTPIHKFLYRLSLYFFIVLQPYHIYIKAVVHRCSVRKVFLEISQNSQENTYFFNKKKPEACNFIMKETLAQVFSCELCEISRNTFLHRTPLVVACLYLAIISRALRWVEWEQNIRSEQKICHVSTQGPYDD